MSSTVMRKPRYREVQREGRHRAQGSLHRDLGNSVGIHRISVEPVQARTRRTEGSKARSWPLIMSALPAFPNPTIRTATAADAQDIAQLSGQLGYPSTAEETIQRLRAVNRHSEHVVYVAEAGGRLVGWIHVFARPSLTTEPSAEVAGLVVDEDCRGRGIGEALMRAAERWAIEQGYRMVTLRSNVKRLRAHAFYERLGYETVKTSKSFRKILG